MCPINVLEMISGARRERSSNLEQLARRLAKGDKVPAAEVLRMLHDCGGSADDLQAEVNRIERVEQLRAAAIVAPALRDELAKLDRKYEAVMQQLAKAQAVVDELHAAQRERHMDLRSQIDVAERAIQQLIEPANLCTADRTALADCDAATTAAGETLSAANRDLALARERMTDGEQRLAKAQQAQQAHPSWQPYHDDVAAAERAVATRTAALAEAEQAAKAGGKDHQSAEAARTKLADRLRREVTK